MKEEYYDLPLSAICSKLKEYKVNLSIMTTNKLIEPLHMIPAMINSEETWVLDYTREGLSNYVARMAGVLPSESFKGPGWLTIINSKDKRKLQGFDPTEVFDLKKAKSEPPPTAADPLPAEAPRL